MRTIRSYVLRESRFTKAQKKAVENFFPIWGITIEQEKQIDLPMLFGNKHNVVVEIGFGMGHSLITQAKNNPSTNYVGIEVYGPGVGTCLDYIEKEKLENIRVIQNDAVVAMRFFPEKSVQKIQIFFPDPWHKKRHNKRRLVQIPFIESILPCLSQEGFIHLATDWEDYATHMSEVMEQIPQLKNTAPTGLYIERPQDRPVTKFEVRGKKLGHKVWDLMYQKI